jgi:hypothetical protein
MNRSEATRAWMLSVMLMAGSVYAQNTQPGRGRMPSNPQPGYTQPGNSQPAPNTPGTPPGNAPNTAPPAEMIDGEAKRPEPTEGRWIKTERVREWVLQVTLGVRSNTNTQRDGDGIPIVTPFDFQTMSVMWPVVPKTAGSEADAGGIAGELILEGRTVAQSFKLLAGYPGGAMLARFDATADSAPAVGTNPKPQSRSSVQSRDVVLNLTVPTTCRRTVFDEPAAMRVSWPKNGWPKDVASALTPQLWVDTGPDETGKVKDYDVEPIREAVKKWLGNAKITDPQASTPVAVAKAITAGVWASIQFSGDGLLSAQTGEFSGMEVNPPVNTLRAGRGTPQDATALLAASFRSVGLPTRTVIGWDVSGKTGKFLKGSKRENKLRVWLEFPVYDEATNELSWVPVDLERLKKSSSRPSRVDVAWKYFGTHDELDYLVPIALQFSPPTDTAFYGAPAFWGWFVTPQTPKEADQSVLIRVTAASKTSDQGQPGRPRHDDREEKRRGTR